MVAAILRELFDGGRRCRSASSCHLLSELGNRRRVDLGVPDDKLTTAARCPTRAVGRPLFVRASKPHTQRVCVADGLNCAP
jgi:hypothetical protein